MSASSSSTAWRQVLVDRAPLLLLAAGVLTLLRALASWEVPPAFVQTHYAFSYEGGLLKRGLVGELLRQIGHVPSQGTVIAVGTLTALAAAGLLLAPLRALYRQGRAEAGTLAYLLMIVTASFTLQPWLAYTGRFDAILFVLMAVACGLALRLPAAGRWLLVLPLALAVFVHEAALFLGVPLALACWWQRAQAQVERAGVLVAGVCLVLLTRWIAVHGSWSEETAVAFLAQMHHRFPDLQGIDTAVAVPVRTSLVENIAYTWDWMHRQWAWRLVHHLAFALLHAPAVVLMVRVWRRARPTLPPAERGFLQRATLAALAPLLLYPIGHDHFRWWVFALMSIALVWTWCAARWPALRAAIDATFQAHPVLTYLAIMSGLFGGPLGFIKAYHFL